MDPFELVFLYSLGKNPAVWLLNCRGVLFFTFRGIAILFSTLAAPVCIPTHCYMMGKHKLFWRESFERNSPFWGILGSFGTICLQSQLKFFSYYNANYIMLGVILGIKEGTQVSRPRLGPAGKGSSRSPHSVPGKFSFLILGTKEGRKGVWFSHLSLPASACTDRQFGHLTKLMPWDIPFPSVLEKGAHEIAWYLD